jgi:hypothetical protein
MTSAYDIAMGRNTDIGIKFIARVLKADYTANTIVIQALYRKSLITVMTRDPHSKLAATTDKKQWWLYIGINDPISGLGTASRFCCYWLTKFKSLIAPIAVRDARIDTNCMDEYIVTRGVQTLKLPKITHV